MENAALDFNGNESDPAQPDATTAADRDVPRGFALYQNSPNPFNPTTTIRYDVPVGGGVVTLRIYDVAGKLIREFHEGEQAAGRKHLIWDGRNKENRSVAAGVYFYKLSAEGFTQTRRMLLLK